MKPLPLKYYKRFHIREILFLLVPYMSAKKLLKMNKKESYMVHTIYYFSIPVIHNFYH